MENMIMLVPQRTLLLLLLYSIYHALFFFFSEFDEKVHIL